MKPSREALELSRLDKPTVVKPGDMYRERCGVMLVLGHKKRGRNHPGGHTWIWLYHFVRGPSLIATPKDLRDYDANGTQAEKWIDDTRARGECCVYVGNIFDLLPLESLQATIAKDLLT